MQKFTEWVFHSLRNPPFWLILLALFIYLQIYAHNTGDIRAADWADKTFYAFLTSLGFGRVAPTANTPNNPNSQNLEIKDSNVEVTQEATPVPAVVEETNEETNLDTPVFHKEEN